MQKLSEFFKSGHGLARRAVSKNLKLLKLVLDSRQGVPVWQIAEARGGVYSQYSDDRDDRRIF